LKNHSQLLGSEHIGKLLLRLSLPAMFAMFITALYNVVDTIFVGRGVGAHAIGGLTVAFPFQIIIMAVALMIGVGSASIVSRALGSGDPERASSTAGNAFSLSAVSGILVAVLGLIFTDPILSLFGATENLLLYAREYVGVVLFGAPFISVAMASNSLVRAEGKAAVAMITMVIGAGLNIILDPIFIFVFQLGIKGAALATVVSQFVSFAYITIFFLSGRSSLEMKFSHLLPNWSVLKEMTILGFPAFVRQFAATFLVVIINNGLRLYGGDLAIAAFGTVNRVLMFAVMPIFGIMQGFQPIAGYNYGARRYDRLGRVLKLANTASTLVALFFFTIMISMPSLILRAFSADPRFIEIGTHAMRIIILILPLVGLQMIGATFFQAIGRAFPSLILSLSRQVILLIPLLLILPIFLQMDGIWLSFPIADGLSTLITMLWVRHEWKKIKGSKEVISPQPELKPLP
jgi:putative MATE family efflux protein